jgi:hypothetical protein
MKQPPIEASSTSPSDVQGSVDRVELSLRCEFDSTISNIVGLSRRRMIEAIGESDPATLAALMYRLP